MAIYKSFVQQSIYRLDKDIYVFVYLINKMKKIIINNILFYIGILSLS